MTNSIGHTGPPSIITDSVRMKVAEVAAARRMIAKYVPEEAEIELRRMLGIHHD